MDEDSEPNSPTNGLSDDLENQTSSLDQGDIDRPPERKPSAKLTESDSSESFTRDFGAMLARLPKVLPTPDMDFLQPHPLFPLKSSVPIPNPPPTPTSAHSQNVDVKFRVENGKVVMVAATIPKIIELLTPGRDGLPGLYFKRNFDYRNIYFIFFVRIHY
jgi:hypothetical protein